MVKRIAALMLLFALAITCTVDAKTKTLNDPIEYTLTDASKTERYLADVDEEGYLRLHLETNTSCDFSVFVRQDSEPTYGKNYQKSEWLRDENNKIYFDLYCPVVKGTARIDVKLKADTEYKLTVVWADTPTDPEYSLSNTGVRIAKGYTRQISVNGYSGDIIWSSNDKSVATVKNGLIKAKSKGVTYVVAKLRDGTKLKCKVRVVANAYDKEALSPADVEYGSSGMKVYYAKYDSKGNMLVYFRVINRDGRPIRKLSGTVTCKSNGTVVAKKTFNFAPNIQFGGHVDYGITIDKKDVKKVVDLTKATFTISNATYNY